MTVNKSCTASNEDRTFAYLPCRTSVRHEPPHATKLSNRPTRACISTTLTCHAHKTQMLSSELVDGLLALNVSTMDDAKALSVEKLSTLPGLSKKGAAQKLKDRLGEILPYGYYKTYVT